MGISCDRLKKADITKRALIATHLIAFHNTEEDEQKITQT